MAFLTIFTAPKPFTNPHIRLIQRNAIQSWLQLGEEVEVLLIGEEEGLMETAREFGIRHLPGVSKSEKGTPYVSSIFALAHEHSNSPILCYANADMILMSDLLTAIRKIASQVKDFLLVGRRHNLDITEPIAFTPGWEEALRQRALSPEGELYSPWGVDYFVFPRQLYTQIPDFVVGRPVWDNWMIYHAVSHGWPAIDLTPSVLVIHQNHDYSHLPGNKPPYGSDDAKSNLAKAGGRRHVYNIWNTTRQFKDGKIRLPPFTPGRALRWLEVWITNPDRSGWRGRIAIRLSRWQRQLENRE